MKPAEAPGRTAQLPSSPVEATSVAAKIHPEAGAGDDSTAASDGTTERTQEPDESLEAGQKFANFIQLGQRGPTLAENAAEKLGIDLEDVEEINAILQTTWDEVNAAQDQHTRLEKRMTEVDGTEKMHFAIDAFADAGAQLREQFASQVSAVLGPEHTSAAAALQEAAGSTFKGFGAYPRTLQLWKKDDTYTCIESRPDLADLGGKSKRGVTTAGATVGKQLPPQYEHLWK